MAITKRVIAILTLLTLAACGGGGNSGVAYTVSVTVSNLQAGTNIVLLNNGADSLTVSANGTIAFAKSVQSGGAYSVTVATQPTGQSCTVTQGSGTATTFNINLAVACSGLAYQIGGTVSGLLPGNSVGLGVTVGSSSTATTISANGPFTFSLPAVSGSAYAVVVSTQPPGENCTVANGTGTVAGANITASVVCSVLSYMIRVNVTGLSSVSGLVLQDNGIDNLALSSSGSYTFSTSLAGGSTYAVTILTQPAGHTCIVQNSSGKVATANVTVSVVCPENLLYAATTNAVAAYYIDATTGSLVAVPGSPFAAGTSPGGIVLAPNGKFIYASNTGDNTISGYSIDPISGALTGTPGSPYAIDGVPLSMAIAPGGSLAFVVTNASNNVTSFNIDPLSGALTPTALGPFAADAGTTNLVIHPSGNFAYTVYTGGPAAGIKAYSVNNTTGALTPIAGVALSGIGSGEQPVFDPTGKFLYVGTYGPNNLYGFTVDSTTGLLGAIPGSPFATGYFDQNFAMYPNGQFLYTPSQEDNTLWGYTVDSSTGALTPIAGNPFATGIPGDLPHVFVIDPSGKFAYLSDGQIESYRIDAATGVLSVLQVGIATIGGQALAIGSIQ